ncbi:GNAT family N-acetyltransferase [Fuscovulum blasticum]|uniref:GNAT family N-acetyltransferase n=1 Tax=Fuscovulum blasticum TaxID=1075 RepID=UPI000D3E9606|nr:GNAT family N-acetyltransferase [Fuscovulum blasticum]AWD23690.1 hypothetical protein B6K69_17830 [Fuscovulum blasticum]
MVDAMRVIGCNGRMARSDPQQLWHYAGPISGETIMPGLIRFIRDIFSVDASPLLSIGHDPETVTFGWWHGSELAANISIFPRRLCLQGTEIQALGIQSVGVRPDFRGKGLFTDLIQKVVAHADNRSCPIVFTTDKPDIFVPWGFRPVPSSAFVVSVQPSLHAPRYRRLAMDQAKDIDLIKTCFATRAPTSLVASTRDHASAFFMAALANPGIEVLHLTDLDAIIAVRGREGKAMILLDVIAASIPQVQDIAAALAYAGSRVILHLTPDLLAPEYDVLPNPYPTPLMVRGSFAPEGLPIMLSRMRV